MKKKPIKRLSLGQKAEKALKEAVRKAIEEHRRAGQPIVVWQDGKVAKIPANKLKKTGS